MTVGCEIRKNSVALLPIVHFSRSFIEASFLNFESFNILVTE